MYTHSISLDVAAAYES